LKLPGAITCIGWNLASMFQLALETTVPNFSTHIESPRKLCNILETHDTSSATRGVQEVVDLSCIKVCFNISETTKPIQTNNTLKVAPFLRLPRRIPGVDLWPVTTGQNWPNICFFLCFAGLIRHIISLKKSNKYMSQSSSCDPTARSKVKIWPAVFI